MKAAKQIDIVCQVCKVSMDIEKSTDAITATEATFTESRKFPASFDFLSVGISGLRIATNINEGKKTPAVAAMAPGMPAMI